MYKVGNFIHKHWGCDCTSIYHPLSYPLRSISFTILALKDTQDKDIMTIIISRQLHKCYMSNKQQVIIFECINKQSCSIYNSYMNVCLSVVKVDINNLNIASHTSDSHISKATQCTNAYMQVCLSVLKVDIKTSLI